MTTDPALLAAKIQAIDEATAAEESRAATGPSEPSRPNYNVAPTTAVATVVRRHSEPGDEPARRVRLMRWGLVPPWAKTGPDGRPENKGPLLINARADKLTSSPVFRSSAKSKRCLVPMDGWYEWRANPDAGGKKAAKTPYFMHRDDGELLYMAGLWSTWRPRGDTAAPLLSCTIITTDAVGQLADVHDRMPLMIDEADWDRWLDPDSPIDERLTRPHRAVEHVQIREVSRLVNSVRNNGPELLAPAEPQPGQATLL